MYKATKNQINQPQLQSMDHDLQQNVNYFENDHNINDKASDDSSFNEPVPSEHFSPTVNPHDLDIDLDIIEMEHHDAEEKQSSPTPTNKNSTIANIFDITNITINNNINESQSTQQPQHQQQHALSELFIAGGAEYWQNINESTAIPDNNELHAHINASNDFALILEAIEKEEIDLSALLDADEDEKSVTVSASASGSTPIASQPPHASLDMRLIDDENDITTDENTQKQNVQLLLSSDGNANELQQNIEASSSDSEYKQQDDTESAADSSTPLMLDVDEIAAIESMNVPDNVPFAIASLFEDTTHPNTIKIQLQSVDNDADDEDDDDDDKVEEEKEDIVIEAIQMKRKIGEVSSSIEDQYKKAQRHASNPEIIVPGSSSDASRTNKIRIYDPIMEETAKEISPDNKRNSSKSNTPEDELTTLQIDYQLETVAKSKLTRRLSFPLDKIDEYQPDSIIAAMSPISPIDDNAGAQDAFGALINEEEEEENKENNDDTNNNNNVQEKCDDDDDDSNNEDVNDEDSDANDNNNNNNNNNDDYIDLVFKLQEAKSKIEDLQQDITRLTANKRELLNRTSAQMEKMRDELQNMCRELQEKDNTIKRLIHVNKEGYDPEHDEKTDTNSRLSWNAIAGAWTYGRSMFSSSIHTVNETKQSKIELAIATATEIQRLRDIIKHLSAAAKQKGIHHTANATNSY